MENKDQELAQRAAFLAEALSQLPTDIVTLSALFDVAISAAMAVTLDPSAARVIFDAKAGEYECRWGSASRVPRLGH